MNIKFVKPTMEMVHFIAEDMRQDDKNEIWASANHTPLEALIDGWKVSDRTAIATVNDKPCVMFGLVVDNILSGTGVLWMLGANESLNYKREFLTQTPAVIEEMLEVCPMLYNYVHIKNKASIRWLKWLGFTLEEPIVYGIEKELFHKFYIKRV